MKNSNISVNKKPKKSTKSKRHSVTSQQLRGQQRFKKDAERATPTSGRTHCTQIKNKSCKTKAEIRNLNQRLVVAKTPK